PGTDVLGLLLGGATQELLRLGRALGPHQQPGEEVPRLGRVRRALCPAAVALLRLLEVPLPLRDDAQVHPGRAGVGGPAKNVLERLLRSVQVAPLGLGDAAVDGSLRVGIGPLALALSGSLLQVRGGRRGGGERPRWRPGDLCMAARAERGDGEQRADDAPHEPPPLFTAGAGAAGGVPAGCTSFAGAVCPLSFATALLTRPSGHVTSTAMAGFGSFRTGYSFGR